MNTHVPGPWDVGGNVYGHSRLAIMNKRAILLAEVCDWPIDTVTDANARLMASAPDLLALASALLSIEVATPAIYRAKGAAAFTPQEQQIIGLQNKARALIAKVNGI